MADKFQLKAIISAVDKMTPTLKGIQRSVRMTKKTLTDVSRAGGDLFAKVGLSTAALGTGLAFAVKKIVGTSAEFERYQTILETIEGSSEKARQSMSWVQDFATRTPYELSQVTDAFVKLKAYGIEPQGGALAAAGNAAAAMGKDVMQAVEALSDAMTGENERLKEFGIKASKQGDTIVYTWSESGKTMAAKAKASSKEMIESTIAGIWNRRYGGAMDKLSGTWDGMWSNMLDGITKFTKMIGAAGFFDAIKGQLSGVLKLFDGWEKDGTMKKIATQISDELVITLKELVGWIKSVDWAEVIRSTREVVKSIAGAIESVGGLKTVMIALGVVMLAGPVLSAMTLIGALARLGIVFGGVALKAVFASAEMAAFAVHAAALSTGLTATLLTVAKFAGLLAAAGAVGYAVGTAIYKGIEGTRLADKIGETVAKVLAFFGNEDAKQALELTAKAAAPVAKAVAPVAKAAAPVAKAVAPVAKAVAPVAKPEVSVARNESRPSSPLVQSGALQVAAGRQQINGSLDININGAPPGTRVSEGKTNQSGFRINPDVGYRSLGYGFAG